MKYRRDRAQLMAANSSLNPALANFQQRQFLHLGKQVLNREDETARNEGIEGIALDFIRTMKVNSKPFINIYQYMDDNNLSDVKSAKEAAKSHFTNPKVFQETLSASLGPWATPAIQAHSQYIFALVSGIAGQALMSGNAGKAEPTIKIMQPELDANLQVSADKQKATLTVTIDRLPVKDIDTQAIIGYIPGPAVATYELVSDKNGDWSYQLLEVETENEMIFRMLNGELIKEEEIKAACALTQSQAHCYAYKNLVAANLTTAIPQENFLTTLEQLYISIQKKKAEGEEASASEKLLIKFRQNLHGHISNEKHKNEPRYFLKALGETLATSTDESLVILKKSGLLNDSTIKEAMKYSMLNYLTTIDKDDKNASEKFSNGYKQFLLLIKPPTKDDKEFVTLVKKTFEVFDIALETPQEKRPTFYMFQPADTSRKATPPQPENRNDGPSVS